MLLLATTIDGEDFVVATTRRYADETVELLAQRPPKPTAKPRAALRKLDRSAMLPAARWLAWPAMSAWLEDW